MENNNPLNNSTIELQQITEILFELTNKGQFDTIDQQYKLSNVNSMNIETMLVMLKTVYVFRNRLKNWIEFRDKCYGEIVARGLDASILMKGLYTGHK